MALLQQLAESSELLDGDDGETSDQWVVLAELRAWEADMEGVPASHGRPGLTAESLDLSLDFVLHHRLHIRTRQALPHLKPKEASDGHHVD